MNLHSYVIILHRVHRNSQNNNVDDNEVINIRNIVNNRK
jgi:hypothetical protein